MKRERDVYVVYRRLRLVLDENDELGEITNFYAGQDEVEDPDEATACVVRWPDDGWSAVDLSLYKRVRTQ